MQRSLIVFHPCEEENMENFLFDVLSLSLWFQCVSTQTFVCSALPSTSVQWPNWRLSKSVFFPRFWITYYFPAGIISQLLKMNKGLNCGT